jgi:nucleoid DNA-binding protein
MPPTLTRARLADALHARVGVSKKEAAAMVEDVVDLLCEASG